MDNAQTDHSRGVNIFLGILLTILGLILLGSQVYASLLSVYFIGWILLAAGVGEFFYAFFSGSFGRAVFFILIGVLSTIIGLAMISNPGLSAVTFTLFIGFYLFISGTFRIIAASIQRESSWGWTVVGGIVSILLAMFILSGWPATGLWVIGLFLGIEFLINGILLMFSRPAYETERVTRGREEAYFSGAKGGKAKKKETPTRHD